MIAVVGSGLAVFGSNQTAQAQYGHGCDYGGGYCGGLSIGFGQSYHRGHGSYYGGHGGHYSGGHSGHHSGHGGHYSGGHMADIQVAVMAVITEQCSAM